MNKIIQFKKPKEKSVEDLFMESLTEQQTELFCDIMAKIHEEYDDLLCKLAKKVTECELLRLENERLKGEIHES